ncbi:MAG: DUF4129 domain-containing protein [Microcystaceae cyanobacterium]
MPKEAFEQNNLGWQLNQLQQKIGEWWELQISRLNINLPDALERSWLDSELVLSIAKIAVWLILALLLIWAILQMTRLVRSYLYTLKNQQHQIIERNPRIIDRTLSIDNWLARSQKFQQQGNYRDSILCLYQAMLQQLNDTGMIPHQASRTDGEYLRLIQNLPHPVPYQRLLIVHQQLCFSNTQASPSLFEECDRAFKTIQSDRRETIGIAGNTDG